MGLRVKEGNDRKGRCGDSGPLVQICLAAVVLLVLILSLIVFLVLGVLLVLVLGILLILVLVLH